MSEEKRLSFVVRFYLSVTTDLLPSAFVDLYIDERTCMSGELCHFYLFYLWEKGIKGHCYVMASWEGGS